MPGFIFGESIAQLKLMLQKKPNDPRILYHLAKSHFQVANYSKSLFYYEKLHQIAGDHPEAVPGISMSLWRLGREYDAYVACRPYGELAGCSKILSTIQDLRSTELPVFELRYTQETASIIDLQQVEMLLKNHSNDPLFIDTIAQYFLDSNLPEFAFDFWSLVPDLLRTKVKIFQRIAKEYVELINQKHRAQLETDESLFHAYYLWKFDPDAAERFPGLSVAKVRTKFESLVQRIGFDTFENYYRLGYLYHLENLHELRRNAFLRADEKAPYELYSFLIRKTLARLEEVKTAVEIDLTEIQTLQTNRKSFLTIDGKKIQSKAQNGQGPSRENASENWSSPSTEMEFQKLLSSKHSSIYLEFCEPKQQACSDYYDNVLNSAEVGRELNSYLKIRVDPTTEVGKALLRSFPVRDIPQIYLLGPGGSFKDEIAGTFDPAQLLKKLKKP